MQIKPVSTIIRKPGMIVMSDVRVGEFNLAFSDASDWLSGMGSMSSPVILDKGLAKKPGKVIRGTSTLSL